MHILQILSNIHTGWLQRKKVEIDLLLYFLMNESSTEELFNFFCCNISDN